MIYKAFRVDFPYGDLVIIAGARQGVDEGAVARFVSANIDYFGEVFGAEGWRVGAPFLSWHSFGRAIRWCHNHPSPGRGRAEVWFITGELA